MIGGFHEGGKAGFWPCAEQGLGLRLAIDKDP